MQELTGAIRAWHAVTARDLPWRGETDPYRIYVSEIMLQQTRTTAVKPYYRRFLDAFPTPEALARADADEVNKLWEGLGYYARARNLQAAMAKVAETGRFPDTRQALLALPGCGEYVSAAVASIAFGERVLALDGNGVRVLSRILGEAGDSTCKAVRERLIGFGTSLLPETGAGEFNQALMGMGNLVCLPKKVLCEVCPAAKWCKAREAGNQLRLPVKPKKGEKKAEERVVAVYAYGGRTLVRKRKEDLLKGLYEFVNLPLAGDWRETLRAAGFPAENGEAAGEYEHVFTHRIWCMRGYILRCPFSVPEGYEAVDGGELARLAMPSAMKYFREIADEALEDGI